jgi:DNA-binding transcriptional ArsR family regulator
MDTQDTVNALSALAQESRLEILRYLVEAGESGRAAGQIADDLCIPPATLSFHLKTLRQAGLIGYRRQGRSLVYHFNRQGVDTLLGSLCESCGRRLQPRNSLMNHLAITGPG